MKKKLLKISQSVLVVALICWLGGCNNNGQEVCNKLHLEYVYFANGDSALAYSYCQDIKIGFENRKYVSRQEFGKIKKYGLKSVDFPIFFNKDINLRNNTTINYSVAFYPDSLLVIKIDGGFIDVAYAP